MLCTKHIQGKNENRHGDTRVSYATYMNVDVYGRRIRIGPGLSASIGLVEGSGDSKTVVGERFILWPKDVGYVEQDDEIKQFYIIVESVHIN